MKLLYKTLCLLLLLLLPVIAISQNQEKGPQKNEQQRGFLFFRINRLDKEGKYHGRWKIFFGEDEQVIRNGRFRHGVEVGKWKYYYPDGTRYMVEKYNRRDNTIQIRKYHENGELARKGQARIIRTPTRDRYFWYGEWEVYDNEGNYSHKETYQSGNLISRSDSAVSHK
ncbi:MAG: hypothetical protein LPK07_15930 [Hymenobacteraceae bacterium]|nr:hypothetical protein [Hymenobacteraceae bacterium]MDX5483169.1 hypothetical protein [Hymenobacteraceae bacterium]